MAGALSFDAAIRLTDVSRLKTADPPAQMKTAPGMTPGAASCLCEVFDQPCGWVTGPPADG